MCAIFQRSKNLTVKGLLSHMDNETRIKLITAIDEYNEVQPDESKHIDVYDVMDKLNSANEDEIAKAIGDINSKIDELEQ